MKSLRLLFVSCFVVLVIVAQAFAGQPFTSTSTGKDWRAATPEYRKEFCEKMAKANQKAKAGITGEFLQKYLDDWYASDDPKTLNNKISEVIAMAIMLEQ